MFKIQTNKTALRTRKAVGEAFVSLINEHDYGQISITDICKRADIARKSFYNNFRSKDDVVEFIIYNLFLEMGAKMDMEYMSLREILLVAFKFVSDNRESLLLFYNKGLIRFAGKSISTYITKHHISGYLNDKVPQNAYKYVAAQISAVLISVIETWMENNFAEPVEFLAELTETMIYKP
jgi:AcrR family transcriptional regulator